MPDYYIAEDGTIHDREAEHRSRTQHTAAPVVADTTAEDDYLNYLRHRHPKLYHPALRD